MRKLFEIKDGYLVASELETAPISVYTLPDSTEKKQLLDVLGHDVHDLESALDPDEISRIDLGTEDTYIIWKRPNNISYEQQLKFEVSSMGIFLQKNQLIIILGEESPPFSGKEYQKITSLNSIVLKLFLNTVRHFLGHLKAIKQMTVEIQAKLNLSMENRYLLQMFSLSESMTYYLNAIQSNAGVLAKMRANAGKIGLSDEETEMLDDIIIDHQQCERQTQIYESVMAGLMDARGTIINNNMNVLLKNLTIISVVFLPLNLIASIGGMSEFSMMTNRIDWKIAYSLFLLAMVIFGWMIWRILNRLNNPKWDIVEKRRKRFLSRQRRRKTI